MDHLAEFLVVSAVVIVTPGPDTTVTIRNTSWGGSSLALQQRRTARYSRM